MPRLLSFLFAFWFLSFGFTSCKPESYSATAPDTLNHRFYCNDPEAVNYNWGFPGKQDNSICRYPTDFFTGTYRYIDSVYLSDGSFDSAGSLAQYILSFQTQSRQKLALYGFCGDPLSLTAGRYFRATLDTSILGGQLSCRALDTISGSISRSLEDSTRLLVSFNIVSDSGVAAHRGTAYRQ